MNHDHLNIKPKHLQQLAKIEEQQKALRGKANSILEPYELEITRACLGRCFRYTNTHKPSGKRYAERWYGYLRAMVIDKDGSLECFHFSRDWEGSTIIRVKEFYMASTLAGYEQISQTAYQNAWISMMDLLHGDLNGLVMDFTQP